MTIPYELRLRIYDFLLPFEINTGNLIGLVLSCHAIKDEVYHEMIKNMEKFAKTLQARWSFEKQFTIAFLAACSSPKKSCSFLLHWGKVRKFMVSDDVRGFTLLALSLPNYDY